MANNIHKLERNSYEVGFKQRAFQGQGDSTLSSLSTLLARLEQRRQTESAGIELVDVDEKILVKMMGNFFHVRAVTDARDCAHPGRGLPGVAKSDAQRGRVDVPGERGIRTPAP